MIKPLVSLIVLTYNSRKYLPALFASIAQQTYSLIECIVVDNASSDGTVDWVKEQSILDVQCIANQTNEWFARGNNKGVRRTKGEYIIFCNDDVALDPKCVEQLVQRAQTDVTIGMLGGKLLKLQNKNIIDSAGITLHRNCQATNRGENEKDTGQYDAAQEIFGISGALMMVSRTALEAVRYEEEYFDEDFIAYKEDVDLSWRMHRAGYRVYYEPRAVAYHARSIQATNVWKRKNKSKIIRAYSYRNHWWTIFKNATWLELLGRLLWFFPYELAKFVYIIFTEWTSVAQLPTIIRGLQRMKQKRIPASANYSLRQWIK